MMDRRPQTAVLTRLMAALLALPTLAFALLLVPAQPASAQVVAFDMVGSASQNLNSHVNPWENAFTSPADGFQKYQRGVSPSIPFAVLDDSVTFPSDSLGIVKGGDTDVFFGVSDTVNGDTSGPVSATWSFDVSGASGMAISIDMAAMGDFEAADTFTWTYSIDGGPVATAFSASADESGSLTYTLESGSSITLNDPMTMQGSFLSNEFQTFSAPIAGSGTELVLTFTAETNGTEAFAFRDILITEGALVPDIVAFDMVGSASQNLNSHVNPWENAFTSPADGFQKYQRGVSPSIPFAVLDDSVTFPSDSLGIVKGGDTDVFFGVSDTVNGDTSGPVSATWSFDVSGASGMAISIDMAAMGDFEAADTFTWTYSIDGGPVATAFSASADESGSLTYTLESGSSITLNDPMTMQGSFLSNEFQTFSAPIAGSGTELVLTFTAETNGTEAFAFRDILITEGGPPLGAVAFDMVASTSENLISFTNPFNGAYSSPADGFQKYRRGVSPSIPFDLLDDSLSIFPSDSHGIVKEGNTDVFFGATDTDQGGAFFSVSATWVFDVSGASGLGLSIDMGAMGDFESSDFFEWTYSIDGGPTITAFASAVDEAGSFAYVLEGGNSFTLNDPMLVQGTVLTNDLAPFHTSLFGSGSELTLTLTARVNTNRESLVFQNIIVTKGNPPPPPTDFEIFEIQGDGAVSPLNGFTVSTDDNVVTATAPNGFFMQTPAARTDGDVNTSDGIFVFTGGAPGVAVGDNVDVTGEVDEFFGFTEITSATVTPDGSGLVPAAVVFDATVPSPDPSFPSCAIEFECYEGMLISIPDGTVTGPNQRFSSDTIAEVHITAAPARTFREPGIQFPGLVGLPVWDGNPEVFELDPNKLGLPNQIIPAGSPFTAVGVLGFEFGGYELWPSSLSFVPAPLPVPVRPRDPGEFTIATLNLERFFDDVDDPPSLAADGRERDDFVVSTAEYLRRRAKLAAHILDVLDAPEVIAVQEVEKLGVLSDLAADIAALDPTVVYSAYLEEGNDPGTIDVGFLVRDTVWVDKVAQLGKAETFVNPLTFEDDILHDRPPLLLEARFPAENVVTDSDVFKFRVLGVHNRSLGGIEGPEALRVKVKRLEQAQSIATMVEDLQGPQGNKRFMVAGDFNAFEFTDGYVDVVGQIKGDFDAGDNELSGPDLVRPNLSNVVDTLIPAGERYSFIFRGSAQVLDHALISRKMEKFTRGAEFGRGNADAAVDLENDDSTPLRSSDHDGLVVFIQSDPDTYEGDGD